ncbi:MAG TPA: LPS export ABC transporter ATP-binding protein [Fimbriimonadaceae bacterium]|nr:LPS export ABC transporter ATP-binding protein [Fimbriimonadaceae bacterium]
MKTITGQHLEKHYRGKPVVHDVSFTVSQGEIVGLLGPNGAGKTTTFYMVTGLIHADGGRVFLDETDVTKWPMFKRARAGMGYLPQEASVFRKLTVEDNIKLVLELVNVRGKAAKAKLDELVEDLHIGSITKSLGNVLSGGERRRVEIARALATDPSFILLDEPFTGIDPVTIEEIQNIIFKLRDRGIGILITDHNIAATLRITDRNYILIDGRIVKEGSGTDITSDPLVRKRYLGESYGNDTAD